MTDLSIPCGKKPPRRFVGIWGITDESVCYRAKDHPSEHEARVIGKGLSTFKWNEPDPWVLRLTDRFARWLRARLT